ncbi:MAG: AAA family ATPase [Rhodospirillales bacterium]|jgi:hypothetical protein|nr:AAA family ATPase [Rhodospirillales bacterium]
MDDNVIDFERWRDFNDAEPQRLDDTRPWDAAEATSDIKARMLLNLRGVLSYLLPGGVFQRGRFLVGDVHGNRGDSLTVELAGPKTGMWHDFATKEGGDIIALWAAVTGRDTRTEFPAIMDDIREWLDGRSRTLHDERAEKAQARTPPLDDLGPVTAKWDYLDEDGRLLACVYRYDPPGGKQFRPWDVIARRMKAPDPRPLYNRPGIKAAGEVILVEGEKAAQALIDQGICATTAMNGASAPVGKTDWSPLAGKRVLVWPDRDNPGWTYATAASQAVLAAGAVSVAILLPPDDKPEKWDAADAVAEGMDVAGFIATAARQAVRPENAALDLGDWHATRYAGAAPEQHFLVEGSFPMGVVSILAAMGDTGKGMMILDLALSVATGKPRLVSVSPEPMAFGGAVREFGTAVIFTAEDDQGEVHRRLQRLDPEALRLERPERLIVVPLPNAGGPIPFVVSGKDGPEITPQFRLVREQVLRLRDLKLVVFDPLASFIHADITADPAAGSFATGLLASLATETGAAVMVAHHMRKPQGNRPIASVEQARDAVRGTSAIVDGVRMVYALWPAPDEHQDAVFKTLEEPPVRNAVFQGAVVKANGPADRTIRTFLRAPTGLLVDVTARLRERRRPEQDLMDALVVAVARAAENGHPYTHTGGMGVYEQRHRLPPAFHDLGRRKLRTMVQALLNERVLVKGMASGSKEDKWLDVPNGPFSRGVGQFVHGAEEGENP